MAITIKDIATVAKVSRGTVDRVLNNRGGVNLEVEERVITIAKALGYKPNSAAKALSTIKKRMVFGVLLPSINNPFFVDLIAGINAAQNELKELGVKIILKETLGYDIDEHLKIIDELLAEEITALALLPLSDDRVVTKINEIVSSGIPVVTINSDIENSMRSCYIGTDFTQSGRLAAGLMGLINGQAKVLILSGSHRLLSHKQRVNGFKEIVNNRFPGIQVVDTLECNDNNFLAYDLVSQSLKDRPEIDALYIKAEGIKGACEAVSKYPERKIRIICFDDVPHVKRLINEGRISATICQQPFQQGLETVQKLFRFFVDNDNVAQKSILMENVIKIQENI